MKRDVAAHVAICDVCQRVKAEHQRPAGLLQPLKVPEWKWEEIVTAIESAKMKVPKNIMSDKGTQIASRFWQKLHESMDTKLNFSSAYHPQTYG